MPDWIVCAHCNLKHRPRPDGCCPRCKGPTADVGAATRPATGLPDIYDGRPLGGQHQHAGTLSRSGSGAMWLGAMALVVAAFGGSAYWMHRKFPVATSPLGGIKRLQVPPAGVAGVAGGEPFPGAAGPDRQPSLPAFAAPAAAPTLDPRWREREQKRVDAMNAGQTEAFQRTFNEGKCTTARGILASISMVERHPGTFELKQGGKVVNEDQKAAVRAESERFLQENCR
jgi:hypothetical protein